MNYGAQVCRVSVICVFSSLLQTDTQQLPADPPSPAHSHAQSTVTPSDQSAYNRVTPSTSDTQLSKPVHPVQPTVQSTAGGYSQPQVYSRSSEQMGGCSDESTFLVYKCVKYF